MLRLIIAIILTLSCVFSVNAETFKVIAPMTNGRPPIVADGDYDWSCIGRCDSGQTDSILQVTTADAKVVEALKGTKDVIALKEDSKTGEVYCEASLKVLKPISLQRIDTKPVEYKVALKVVEEEPKETELPK